MAALVVVIDDDRCTRVMLREVLMMEDYSVLLAADGHQALKILYALPCRAVVVLDYMMPVCSGYDVMQMLNLNPELRDRYAIVLMSGWRGLRDIAIELEVDDYLAKPFDIDQLLETIKHAQDVLHRKGATAPFDTLKYVCVF
jgi:two-component system response regulator CpxR